MKLGSGLVGWLITPRKDIHSLILFYFICDKSGLCVNYGKLVDSHMLYGQDHLTLEEEMYLLFYFYFSKTKSHPTLI